MLPQLKLKIGADTKDAEKGLERTSDKLSRTARAADKSRRAMRRLGPALKRVGQIAAAAAAAAAAASGLLLKSSLANIDAQAKLARTLNTTVASMQTLERAAELQGVSFEQLSVGLRDFFRRTSQAAAAGKGPVVDAFKAIKTNISELNALPLDERVALVNERLREFVPAAQRAAVAGQLFGEKASLLLTRLDADTISQANDELRELGVLLSDVDAAKVEAANDAMTKLSTVITGIGNRLAIQLAPTLQRVSDLLAESAKEGGALNKVMAFMGSVIRDVIQTASAFIAIIAAIPGIAAEAWDRVIAGLGGIEYAFKALAVQMKIAWTEAMDWILAKTEGFLLELSGAIAGVSPEWAADLVESAAAMNASMLASQRAIGGMRSEAEEFANVSADAFRGALMPMESLNELGDDLVLIFGDIARATRIGGKVIEDSMTGAKDALGGAKDAVSDLAVTMKDKWEGLASTIEDGMTNAFMSTLDGVSSTKDAFRTMAKDIIRELYRVLVVQQLVGSYGVGGRGGSGILGAIGGLFGIGDGVGFGSGLGGTSGFLPTWPAGGPMFTPLSFAGGGSTGMGARSGGVDGRGGFPAILHPKETVIDHTQAGGGGGGGVTVNQTIQISTGVQATVRSEIMSLMPQIAESSKLAVLEARQRGGAFAGAFR